MTPLVFCWMRTPPRWSQSSGTPARTPCTCTAIRDTPWRPACPVGAPKEVDEDQNEEGGDEKNAEGGGTYPASIDLSDSDAERRTLHVDPDTGLVTLSLIVPFASLAAPTFEAVVDDFIADMNLWSMLFANEAPVSEVDVGSRDSDRDGGGRMPWGAIVG
jgi:hypothetical protein